VQTISIYKNTNKIYLEPKWLVRRVKRLLDGPTNNRSSISGSDNTFFFTLQRASSQTLRSTKPHKQCITRGLLRTGDPYLHSAYCMPSWCAHGHLHLYCHPTVPLPRIYFAKLPVHQLFKTLPAFYSTPESSTTCTTRQWPFEFEPYSRHAIDS
jgi:hypothetical protein